MNIEKQALNKITEVHSLLKQSGLIISGIDKKSYNYEFNVSNGSSAKLKVQVYFGKKGVKTVLQGNKETEVYSIVNELVFKQSELQFNQSNEIDFDNYIGSDETGKGDLFGPMVICAFDYNEEMYEPFGRLSVQDSKNMSRFQITNCATGLIKKYPDSFEVVTITPVKYNELYKNFRNLNKMLNWAHSKAINNLLAKSETKNIIVDKFSNEQLLLQDYTSLNIQHTHKGERFLGVAAASIIARYHFDKWFERNNKFALKKGASVETTKIAEKIFDDYGIDALRNVAKLHFKSIKNFSE